MSSLQWIMLISFVFLFGLSVWKLRFFLSTHTLKDDDRTPQAKATLDTHLREAIKTLQEEELELSIELLYERMIEHPEFDREFFWRFNPNRLRMMIDEYYARYLTCQKIEDIIEHNAIYKEQ